MSFVREVFYAHFFLLFMYFKLSYEIHSFSETIPMTVTVPNQAFLVEDSRKHVNCEFCCNVSSRTKLNVSMKIYKDYEKERNLNGQCERLKKKLLVLLRL